MTNMNACGSEGRLGPTGETSLFTIFVCNEFQIPHLVFCQLFRIFSLLERYFPLFILFGT